jgi:hypothetical protein
MVGRSVQHALRYSASAAARPVHNVEGVTMSSGKPVGRFFESFTKLFSVVAVAALGVWFSGPAHAWGTGPTTTSFGFSGHLDCSGAPFSGTLTPGSTQATETSTLKCSFFDVNSVYQGTGTFKFNISYTGMQSSCNMIDANTSVRTYSAWCQNGTTVSGTLTWVGDQLNPVESLPAFCGTNNPCVLNVGGFPMNGNKVSSKGCQTAFPATYDANGNPILAETQVLRFDEIYRGSNNCSGGSVDPQAEISRYCHSDSFDPSQPTVCIVKVNGVIDVKKGDEVTSNGIVVNIDVQPNSINTSCSPVDNGVATATVFGSATLNAGLIDPNFLTLGGQTAQLGSCSLNDTNSDGFPDLTCKFATCPTMGPTLAGTTPNADGTVTIVLTGKMTSGTAIQGTENVKIPNN